MKYSRIMFVFLLIPQLVFSDDVVIFREGIKSLKEKLEQRTDKCPRITVMSSSSPKTEEDHQYYTYATNEIVSNINQKNEGIELQNFKARLAVLIEKGGQVEAIELLELDPETQKNDIEDLLKHGMVKLNEIPFPQCEKYELIFTVNYNLQNEINAQQMR